MNDCTCNIIVEYASHSRLLNVQTNKHNIIRIVSRSARLGAPQIRGGEREPRDMPPPSLCVHPVVYKLTVFSCVTQNLSERSRSMPLHILYNSGSTVTINEAVGFIVPESI